MKLSEYIKLSREERTTHIDLDSPCDLSDKAGKQKRIFDWFDLEDDIGNWAKSGIERCHLCKHDSHNGYCSNPLHIYIGTKRENRLDIEPEVRSQIARTAGKEGCHIGGKRSAELGVGVHDKSDPRVIEGNRKGGKRAAELEAGFHNPESRIKGGKRAHQLGVGLHDQSDPRVIEGRRKGAQKSSSQRWMSTADGLISHSGGVSLHNRSIEVGKDERIRLNPREYLYLLPQTNEERMKWLEGRK